MTDSTARRVGVAARAWITRLAGRATLREPAHLREEHSGANEVEEALRYLRRRSDRKFLLSLNGTADHARETSVATHDAFAEAVREVFGQYVLPSKVEELRRRLVAMDVIAWQNSEPNSRR
jgi:hypothetical protein